MSKRNVSYVKPAEPKFLAELKAEIGYKEGPTVDTKREINPEISDDENCEKDEEQPVVVVLRPGDLTAEEVAQIVSKKNSDSSDPDERVPADGRILYRRPAKREAPKESSKAEERMKERRKKVKGVKNASLLSFGEDDEVDTEDT